jgi:hypothetical protein
MIFFCISLDSYIVKMLLLQLDEIVNHIAYIMNSYVYHPPNLFLHMLNESCLELHKKTQHYISLASNHPKGIHALGPRGLEKCREIMLKIVLAVRQSPVTDEDTIKLMYLHTLFYPELTNNTIRDKLEEYCGKERVNIHIDKSTPIVCNIPYSVTQKICKSV